MPLKFSKERPKILKKTSNSLWGQNEINTKDMENKGALENPS
jgi:hypothetical protein